MDKVRIGLFAAIVVGVIGYRVFFVDSDEVIHFNDTLVDMVGKSNSRFEPIGGQVQAYAAGKQISTDQMTQMQGQLVKLLSKDVAKLKGYEIPECETCKEFHTTCLAYMENSLAIAEGYTVVIKNMGEKNPGTEDDLAASMQPIAELLDNDDTLFDKVTVVQKKMAKKYDFKLE